MESSENLWGKVGGSSIGEDHYILTLIYELQLYDLSSLPELMLPGPISRLPRRISLPLLGQHILKLQDMNAGGRVQGLMV